MKTIKNTYKTKRKYKESMKRKKMTTIMKSIKVLSNLVFMCFRSSKLVWSWLHGLKSRNLKSYVYI